jgi:hypothetical protein
MPNICDGLDLINKSYIARQTKGGIRYEYPFRVYPPPSGFIRGTFDQGFMDVIIGLLRRLISKAKTGGRVQMDAIELRAAIFSIRANIDFVRRRRRFNRRASPEAKAMFQLDNESFVQLKDKSNRVIHTLERHLKRANRTLIKDVTRDAYDLLMHAWRLHLRWMWLHIAYFKPMPPVIGPRRIRHQRDLDELTKMARSGIEGEGLESPDDQVLRKMMRLYVRSARRGREGKWTAAFLRDPQNRAYAPLILSVFVLRRLDLKEAPQ